MSIAHWHPRVPRTRRWWLRQESGEVSWCWRYLIFCFCGLSCLLAEQHQGDRLFIYERELRKATYQWCIMWRGRWSPCGFCFHRERLTRERHGEHGEQEGCNECFCFHQDASYRLFGGCQRRFRKIFWSLEISGFPLLGNRETRYFLVWQATSGIRGYFEKCREMSASELARERGIRNTLALCRP